MKKINLINKAIAALTFSAIFIAGLPTIAFSSTTIIKVCREDNNSGSKVYVSLNNNGQTIVVETYADGGGIHRNTVKDALKNSYNFSDDEANAVFNALEAYDNNTGNPLCQPTTSAETPAETITLTGTIRDFQASHPDFESTIGTDRNIVTLDLGADKKPVYGNHPNGTTTTSGRTNFDQWYRDVEGINKSKEHSIELTLQPDGTYKYQNNQFFPINGELWGNYINNKNYHFTYELHTQFTYQGGETFAFSGDDDVWVYIDGKRVIDIGGVHTSQSQSVDLDDLNLTVGETYDLDFFFAERHYSQSNFTITTNIVLADNSFEDSDIDNNGILDKDEIDSDIDNDGLKNFEDLDDDGDNIADVHELYSLSQINNTGTKEMTERSGVSVVLPNPPTEFILPDDALNTDGVDEPDYQDTDTDNDQFLDESEAGDRDLGTAPFNSDSSISGDSIADFRDLDSDDNGIIDQDEIDSDVDNDGIENFQDLDDDGDNIIDLIEIGADPTNPTNSDNASDNDDYQDTDSDNDAILDSEEGVKSSADGTTAISITYPNSSGDTTYNLQDSSLADTKKDSLACVTEEAGSTCGMTSTLTTNGKVDVSGTITGLDYQVPTFAD